MNGISSIAADTHDLPVLPASQDIDGGRWNLISSLPEKGLGLESVQVHLQGSIIAGLNRSGQSPNYYGFVTGGATPAASFADNVVTQCDQNVAVHLPKETIATDVENQALHMICQLLKLAPSQWPHRTFTTGATASNVIGLACGREHVIAKAAHRNSGTASVAEHGLFMAMRMAGLEGTQILTTVPHSSLRKAASIIGLGRACVLDIGRSNSSHRFDLAKLEHRLQSTDLVSIVAVSCAEVNTGFFATDYADMCKLRELCDQYSAWLHVDAAFGALARVLPDGDEYHTLHSGVAGLELADSITADAHKLLNVPYDCGIFLSRDLSLGMHVFHNPNAAYLTTTSTGPTAVPSPLNLGIENSRRFRALPIYATLAAYGRDGYRQMLEAQIRLARAIATFILATPGYELLPLPESRTISANRRLSEIYIVVLFRAWEDQINGELVQRINSSRRIYVSGTQWDGKPAARFAVANWQVDVERDIQRVRDVLLSVLR